MTKKELIAATADYLHDTDVRKPVSSPRHVFHITDDEGNGKDFIVRATEKTVMYTQPDVKAVLDAMLYVIEEALKSGDSVTISGFGTLGYKYKRGGKTVLPTTGKEYFYSDRYLIRFKPGNTLKNCAKVFNMASNDRFMQADPVYEEDIEADGE